MTWLFLESNIKDYLNNLKIRLSWDLLLYYYKYKHTLEQCGCRAERIEFIAITSSF